MKDFDAQLATSTSLTPVELQAAVQRAGDFGRAGAAAVQAKSVVPISIPTIQFAESRFDSKGGRTGIVAQQQPSGNPIGDVPVTNTTIWLSKSGVATEYNIYLTEV